MPELPEVQTIVSDLIKKGVVGVKIIKAAVFWPGSIAEPDPSEFCSQILGQKIHRIERKGKYISIQLESSALLIHLRMSGRLLLNQEHPISKYDRVHFFLEDGRVIKFIDQRKFGRLYLLEDSSRKLGQLGPDPMDAVFTLFTFKSLLNRKMKIKTLLLNQKIISGIGNIYADEALWEAKIHPETLATHLSNQETERLFYAIKRILDAAIKNQGTSLGHNASNFHSVTGERGRHIDALKIYQKTGLPCSRCRTLISKIKLNGRGTHFCPKCQLKK